MQANLNEIEEMKKLLGMMPGMGQMREALDNFDEREVDRIEAIVCSMTPAERRPIIAEICLREHVLIVEDNPYGLLGFHNDPLPAIASYSPEGVVYLGSFSKMLI